MKNPLTYRMESSLGAVFISLLALFFTGLMFTAVKNFESDIDVMTSNTSTVSALKVSPAELNLVREWIDYNHIEVPEGSGYKYLVRKYPNKPWLD